MKIKTCTGAMCVRISHDAGKEILFKTYIGKAYRQK